MEQFQTCLSRFQVLSEGRQAWTQDDRGCVFYFDGYLFWRHKGSGAGKLVPSWQCPHHGWEHESQCSCSQCHRRAWQDWNVA
jgi:hypothetical protein